MKTEAEAVAELAAIRKRLERDRSLNRNNELLYGAQQALGWMLNELGSPSELDDFILKLAKEECQ